MVVIVNGREKLLEMRGENGVDIAADFVGNTGYKGLGHDSDGRLIMSQVDYGWWLGVISDHQRLAAEIAEARKLYGDDAVDAVLDGEFECDLEDQPGHARIALESLK